MKIYLWIRLALSKIWVLIDNLPYGSGSSWRFRTSVLNYILFTNLQKTQIANWGLSLKSLNIPNKNTNLKYIFISWNIFLQSPGIIWTVQEIENQFIWLIKSFTYPSLDATESLFIYRDTNLLHREISVWQSLWMQKDRERKIYTIEFNMW